MLVTLLVKFRNKDLQNNRARVSFASLASSYSHFCRNSREPPKNNNMTKFRSKCPTLSESELRVFSARVRALHFAYIFFFFFFFFVPCCIFLYISCRKLLICTVPIRMLVNKKLTIKKNK